MKQHPVQFLLAMFMMQFAAPVVAGNADAVLQWARQTVLSSPVSGLVDKIHVEVGKQVQKQDLLLELDGRPYRIQIEQARARVAAAQAALDEAQREKQRAEELFDRTVLSIRDQDLVAIDLAKAGAELAAASTELKQAELNLEYSQIRAPYAGLIVARYVSAGETVIQSQLAQPMLKMVSNRSMAAVALISPEDAAKLKLAGSLPVQVNGQEYSGKITQLGYELQTRGKLSGYRLMVVFDLPDGVSLRQGQPASIKLQ